VTFPDDLGGIVRHRALLRRASDVLLKHGKREGMRRTVQAGMALALALVVTQPVLAARAKPNQRQVGDITARCVVGAERPRVRALLSTLPGSPAELRAAKRLSGSFEACSEGGYRLTAGRRGSGLFNGRADLAAAMALDAADGGARARAGAPAWYLASVKTASRNGFDPVMLGVAEFGACVVAADPDYALALVRADAGGLNEAAAVTALRPALAPCIAREQKLNFTRDELRLVVAEPLYHALTGDNAPATAR